MSDFPESFLCPLTQQPMQDPVMDPEGTTYERAAIEDWLGRNPTSPITRTAMTKKDLIPNRSLREAIEEHCKTHNIKLATVNLTTLPSMPRVVSSPAVTRVMSATAKTTTTTADAKDDGQNEINLVLRSTSTEEGECIVSASIVPPNGTTRTPTDIVCVIDVSGSMGINATVQNASGGLESNNLSILDIVKHAVKTIIATLQPCDRLGLVSYSTQAKKIFGLTQMDAAGKAKAQRDLDTLDANGQTNLWDGLHNGLEIIREGNSPNRLSAVFLLTDGQPNIAPPRGHVPMLQRYKAQHPSLLYTINTFGFGYQLDSTLLADLCQEGHGMYAFIPDAGFVGTAFANSMSNLLVTMGRNPSLVLTCQNGAQISQVYGLPSSVEGDLATIPLASLQYGQSRDVVFKLGVPKLGAGQTFLTATLQYQHWSSAEFKAISVELSDPQQGDANLIEAQLHRSVFVDTLKQALVDYKMSGEELKGGQAAVKQLREKIRASKSARQPHVVALLQDIDGQVTEAWSKDEWFKKWGIHYLPSLVRAHQLQQCNNFKDPGIQIYGGALFKQIQEEADDLFCKLPPPTRKEDNSFQLRGWGGAARGAAPPMAMHAAPHIDMSMYNDRSAGCIDGMCLVLMADGSSKRVRDVAKGDHVRAGTGRIAEVRCVVVALCEGSVNDLVELDGGLRLTPYHPVQIAGKWHFPKALGAVELQSCAAVYNFVLASEHSIVVNGIACVTLGHGLAEPVVQHPFFGTSAVIHDLKALRQGRSFDLGLIRFAPGCLMRNRETGLLCGYDGTRQLD
jgi:Mg-chelatase subunit ChlD